MLVDWFKKNPQHASSCRVVQGIAWLYDSTMRAHSVILRRLAVLLVVARFLSQVCINQLGNFPLVGCL